MPTSTRWTRRPEGSTWGDFGPDDQLGRLNLLTPEKVRQGAAEVTEGLAFCLSLPLEYPGGNVLSPRRFPPVVRPTLRGDHPNMNVRLGKDIKGATDIVSDDLVVLHLQYSTQWDSFAHVGSLFDVDGDGVPEAVYYNGFRAGEDVVGPESAADAGVPMGPGGASTSQAKRLGVENMAVKGMQGRGVLIDLAAHVGRARDYIGYDELMRIMAADRVEVETGDMVLLHTGFGEFLLEQGGKPTHFGVENTCAVLDGRDQRLLQWITDSGLVALMADNYAVEATPSRPGGDVCAILPLHEHCLFKLGVHLGELWYLTELATWLRAHGRNRFLLTAPPLRLTGAVGSPATPIATV
ncbi:cyclase family protein [Chelatococcus reniformis]|uniref:Cyclase n=1 Tax=Chelatococcus reniformis TaxID=1494448 RepID=A0A916TY17_9HYPH|nr:cyclase family protein [Chelatococcus reniformis]GGC51946.1 cyclase [Chelatococcus reniformis]